MDTATDLTSGALSPGTTLPEARLPPHGKSEAGDDRYGESGREDLGVGTDTARRRHKYFAPVVHSCAIRTGR